MTKKEIHNELLTHASTIKNEVQTLYDWLNEPSTEMWERQCHQKRFDDAVGRLNGVLDSLCILTGKAYRLVLDFDSNKFEIAEVVR